MNEPIVAVIVGLLLAVSAGVRITLPLLAVNLLAYNHVITLPEKMAWLSSQPTLILLCVACAAETLIDFLPAVGTYLKALATPLAFAGGTILMAVPLGDHNPIYQWAIAGVLGGGAATFTHLGVTGARTMTAPANVATAGIFGVIWNIGEMLVSLLLIVLGGICLFAGIVIAVVVLAVVVSLATVLVVKLVHHWRKSRAVPPPDPEFVAS